MVRRVPRPFRYAFRGERAVDTLLIGGGLHLVSVYLPVVPLVVVLGYLVSVLGTAVAASRAERFDALPPFRDVPGLIRRGVGGTAVVAAFLSPAAVTLLVTVAGLSRLSLSPDELTAGTSLGFVAGSTASLLLAAVFVYLLPAALANYETRSNLRAAVDVDVLRRAGTNGAYFYNVLAGVAAGGLLLVVARATTPYAVGFFVAFYAELVAVGYWSRGVAVVLDTGRTDD